MIEQGLFILGGVSISVIGYFLKKTLDEIEKVKEVAYENRNRLGMLEVDYLNKINGLNARFDDLKDSIRDLTTEIKALNLRMNQQQ